MTFTTTFQLIALATLFLMHALYMKYLFESLRRKIYMDVMDYLIVQGRMQTPAGKAAVKSEKGATKSDRGQLRLIRSDDF